MESSSSSSSSSISKKMVRRAIRMVVMAVGAGILMMWIMLPTKTFRQNWLLTIRRELNHSTYFGRQGTNLVIFTVPVLFIAAMGCIYLHLTRDTRGLYGHRKDNKVKALMMNNLKRPVLVRGPLGIVSGMELSFFLMFIVLLVWSLWLYLYNNFARITPASAAKNGVHV
ncbi:hypothetical protein SAY86_020437 [Trapa natans]|uniref:Uncharacterized protein n=1 Tax=Trapa natans TaxID=22666 RepID=A0AAN7LJ09_TRANT|nr:hypothetical protein SAY86_020437 [Trapa natans]